MFFSGVQQGSEQLEAAVVGTAASLRLQTARKIFTQTKIQEQVFGGRKIREVWKVRIQNKTLKWEICFSINKMILLQSNFNFLWKVE